MSMTVRESIHLTLAGRLNDKLLMAVVATLILLGLVMVASSSVAIAQSHAGPMLYYFWRQSLFALLGLAAAFVMYCIPTKQWEQSSFALLALALVLLVAVLVPGIGVVVNGARRWIDLGPANIQASEPARMLLFMYLAAYITRHTAQVQNRLRGLLKPVIPLGIAALLLLMEPDFGATAILLAVSGCMLFLAGAKLSHLALLGSVAIGGLVMLVMTSPYRLARVVSFADPWEDPFNRGFQLTQSLIAIGRGNWTGVGLGNSVQKLLYLPEMHTDFQFAIFSEEFGLLGALVLMALFAVVVWRGFCISRAAAAVNHAFGSLVAASMASWIGMQAFVNMAVNMGLLPTKGLTMPFLSSGGSSLLVMCAAVGLLLRIDREARLAAKEQGATDQPPQPKAEKLSKRGKLPPSRLASRLMRREATA